MSGRWWRAYTRARHDPKMLKLSDKDFRWWFNLICVAGDNDGRLPYIRDIAAEFRVSEQVVAVAIERLRLAGLFEIDGEPGPDVVYVPHNWNGLQYKSDVSNDRVKRFRERQRNEECNVTETPSESDTDSEADTEQTKAKALGSAPAQKPKRKTALPKDFQASERQLAYAAEHGCTNPPDTAERFRLHHLSKGTVAADWDLAFQYWCRNEQKFNGSSSRENRGETWNERRIREGMAVIMGGQK